jgi:purine-binding chemotaxis protein CheW
MDLSQRFGKPSNPVTKRTCIVIIERGAGDDREDLGVIVDAVNAVLEIPAHEVELPPAFGARIRTEFIRGLGKVNGKFVIILDVERVLAVDMAAADVGAEAEAEEHQSASA